MCLAWRARAPPAWTRTRVQASPRSDPIRRLPSRRGYRLAPPMRRRQAPRPPLWRWRRPGEAQPAGPLGHRREQFRRWRWGGLPLLALAGGLFEGLQSMARWRDSRDPRCGPLGPEGPPRLLGGIPRGTSFWWHWVARLLEARRPSTRGRLPPPEGPGEAGWIICATRISSDQNDPRPESPVTRTPALRTPATSAPATRSPSPNLQAARAPAATAGHAYGREAGLRGG